MGEPDAGSEEKGGEEEGDEAGLAVAAVESACFAEEGGGFGLGSVAVEVAADVLHEGVYGGVSILGLGGAGFFDDGGDGGGFGWLGLALVGFVEGGELIEDAAEGVDLGLGGFGGAGVFLLGGHVAGGALDDGVELVSIEVGIEEGDGVVFFGVGALDFSHAPVADLDFSEVSDLDVIWFEVEVEDAAGVGVGDGLADAEDDGEAALVGVGVEVFSSAEVGEDFPEGGSGFELHREVGAVLIIDAHVEEFDDIGVLEAGGDVGFAEEGIVALDGDAFFGVGEGDAALGAFIVDAVDFFHAAFSDEFGIGVAVLDVAEGVVEGADFLGELFGLSLELAFCFLVEVRVGGGREGGHLLGRDVVEGFEITFEDLNFAEEHGFDAVFEDIDGVDLDAEGLGDVFDGGATEGHGEDVYGVA